VVKTLDPELSSHAQRIGVINEALAKGFSLPSIAAGSGHSAEDTGQQTSSALLHYFLGSANMATPVMASTAGWPFQGSTYTRTPSCPSLDALFDEAAFTSLGAIADTLFCISTTHTPWLASSGRLRFMTETFLASQIMYYMRRKNRYTTAFIPCKSLVGAVVAALGVPRTEADIIICRWGDKVHAKFVADNQRSIIDASLVPTLAKLTDAVVGMQGSVASVAATIASVASQQSVLLELMMRRDVEPTVGSGELQSNLMTAIFSATAASAKAVAEIASASAVTLREAGNSLVSPISNFPHNEPRRIIASSAVTAASASSIQAAVASAAATTVAAATAFAGLIASVGHASVVAATNAANGEATSALNSAAADHFSGGADVRVASAPQASVIKTSKNAAGVAAPSSVKVAASATTPPSWGPIVSSSSVTRVLIDSKAPLSVHLHQSVIHKLAVVRTHEVEGVRLSDFNFRLSTVIRETRTTDAACRDGVGTENAPVSKQTMGKISKGLLSLEKLATRADREVLRLAYGSSSNTARENALVVSQKLEGILCELISYLNRQSGETYTPSAVMSSNAFDGAVRALCAKLSVDDVEALKASFDKPPSQEFWDSLVGGPFESHVKTLGEEAAAIGGSTSASASSTSGGAAGAGSNGGTGSMSEKKRQRREAAAAATATAATKIINKKVKVDIVAAAAADSASRSAAVTQPILPPPVSLLSMLFGSK
jgi:hypothetical protein